MSSRRNELARLTGPLGSLDLRARLAAVVFACLAAGLAVGVVFSGASDTLTVTNSGGATFQSAVDAATVAITDTADNQTVVFQGDLTVGTGMTVAANDPNPVVTPYTGVSLAT